MIQSLKLKNFRCYSACRLEFPEGFVVLFGKNGTGKTTILEALHLLTCSNSFRSGRIREMVRQDHEEGLLGAEFHQPSENLEIIIRNGRKYHYRNGVFQKKAADYLRGLSSVTLSPEHLEMLGSGSENRRKFLDHLISGLDANFFGIRTEFQRVLSQKQALLRKELPFPKFKDEVEPWNLRLIELSTLIRRKRWELVRRINPLLQEELERLAQKKDSLNRDPEPQIVYPEPPGPEAFSKELESGIQREYASQRALFGPQRDPVEILLYGRPVSYGSSQGERSSILLSLKFAEARILNANLPEVGREPLLLFDDVGATLDQDRRTKLFERLSEEKSQAFITTADPHVLESAVSSGARLYQRFEKDLGEGFSIANWAPA